MEQVVVFIQEVGFPIAAAIAIGELFRTHLQRIDSFSQESQKWVFPQFYFFGNVLPCPDEF